MIRDSTSSATLWPTDDDEDECDFAETDDDDQQALNRHSEEQMPLVAKEEDPANLFGSAERIHPNPVSSALNRIVSSSGLSNSAAATTVSSIVATAETALLDAPVSIETERFLSGFTLSKLDS